MVALIDIIVPGAAISLVAVISVLALKQTFTLKDDIRTITKDIYPVISKVDMLKEGQMQIHSKIDRLEENLIHRISEDKKELISRIDNTKAEMTSRINETKSELTNCISETKAEMISRINETKSELTNCISETKADLVKKIDDGNNYTKNRLDMIDGRINTMSEILQNMALAQGAAVSKKE